VLRLLIGDAAKESENLRYNYDIVDDGYGNLKYVPKNKFNLQSVKEFYPDFDINNVNIHYDNNSRIEGNNIYADSDESIIHELWHYLSQNKPNEIYKEFYDNLND
jgi:hypothetical protein